MKVTEIVIFPVKSCAGVSVEHSKINQFGLEFDRFWVIARKRDQWEMMTQRNFSRMVLIKPEIELNRLVLRAPDMSDITVPLESKGESIQIKVWDDLVYGISQGDEVSQWLTKCLGVKCALFAKDLNNVRTLSPEHTPSNSLFAYQPQVNISLNRLHSRMVFPFYCFQRNLSMILQNIIPTQVPFQRATFDRIL